MSNENYYNILEVNLNATLDDIKKAFRRLSLKLHPDKNENSLEKTESFRKIVEAYKILSDPDKKANYDKYNGNPDARNENPYQNPNRNQAFQIDPNEMIKMMFQNPYFNDLANDIGEKFENDLKNKDNISSNFISQLFNQNNPHFNNRFRQRPKSIKKNVEITLEQAFTGCTVPIVIERTIRENGFKRDRDLVYYYSKGYR